VQNVNKPAVKATDNATKAAASMVAAFCMFARSIWSPAFCMFAHSGSFSDTGSASGSLKLWMPLLPFCCFQAVSQRASLVT